jgi:hypothetical protein
MEVGAAGNKNNMKIDMLIGSLSVSLLVALPTKAQGTFQNLNFESADLSAIPAGQYGGLVPIASALPGWGATVDGVAVTQIFQNNYTITGPSVDIFGPNWNSVNPGIIDGNYTVFLQSVAVPGETDDASISQSGAIPSGTESIQLKAWSVQATPEFSVSFDGNNLSAVALSTGQSASGQEYTVDGFNVAAYSGDSGQLQIATFVPSGNGQSEVEFDDIAFSPQAVPEPDPLALTGIGAVLFALYRRFAPKRQ